MSTLIRKCDVLTEFPAVLLVYYVTFHVLVGSGARHTYMGCKKLHHGHVKLKDPHLIGQGRCQISVLTFLTFFLI